MKNKNQRPIKGNAIAYDNVKHIKSIITDVVTEIKSKNKRNRNV